MAVVVAVVVAVLKLVAGQTSVVDTVTVGKEDSDIASSLHIWAVRTLDAVVRKIAVHKLVERMVELLYLDIRVVVVGVVVDTFLPCLYY